MSKPNIIVHRYAQPCAGYTATVSPEGGGWTLFLPADGGTPDLWIETATTDEHGASVRAMVPARGHADPRRPTPMLLPDLPVKALRNIGANLCDSARDLAIDRIELQERHGYDHVAATAALGEYLRTLPGAT